MGTLRTRAVVRDWIPRFGVMALAASLPLALASAEADSGPSESQERQYERDQASMDLDRGEARYNSRTIDLSESWEGAQICSVYDVDDDVWCFDDEAEAEDHDQWKQQGDNQGEVVAASGDMQLALDCGNDNGKWLKLYEHANFDGRTLQFNDVTDWYQNLTDWGFNDQMSSWANQTICDSQIREHINGGGACLDTPNNSSSSWVGWSWNDVASSLKIARAC